MLHYSREFADATRPPGFDRLGWRALCWLGVRAVNGGIYFMIWRATEMRLWDWFCYRRSQWHARAALTAMGRMDYVAAQGHIRAAAKWERAR